MFPFTHDNPPCGALSWEGIKNLRAPWVLASVSTRNQMPWTAITYSVSPYFFQRKVEVILVQGGPLSSFAVCASGLWLTAVSFIYNVYKMGLFWVNYHFVKNNSYEAQIHQVGIVKSGPQLPRQSLSFLICKTGIKCLPQSVALRVSARSWYLGGWRVKADVRSRCSRATQHFHEGEKGK